MLIDPNAPSQRPPQRYDRRIDDVPATINTRLVQWLEFSLPIMASTWIARDLGSTPRPRTRNQFFFSRCVLHDSDVLINNGNHFMFRAWAPLGGHHG